MKDTWTFLFKKKEKSKEKKHLTELIVYYSESEKSMVLSQRQSTKNYPRKWVKKRKNQEIFQQKNLQNIGDFFKSMKIT